MKVSLIYTAVLLTASVSSPLSAQIHKSPADTGKIQWGYSDVTPYQYPTMCDRAGHEFLRYQTRHFTPDTSLAAMLDSTAATVRVSDEGRDFVRTCLSQYDLPQVPSTQLWGYARSALLVDDDEKTLAAVERLIREAPDSALRENTYATAIMMFFANAPKRLDLVSEYLKRLDALTPSPPASSVTIRNFIATYWRQRYYADSVIKYARQSMEFLNRMDPQLREAVDIAKPYITMINMANDRGDLAAQEQWLDSLQIVVENWRAGQGNMLIAQIQQLIDFRKSLYGKRANPITVGRWFNTQGQAWPVDGKVSMLVLVDHLCGLDCYPQYKTINRLKKIFGDQLAIALVTQSSGYSIGTSVLDEQQEGDSVVKLFTTVYDMPFPVLLDPRPISKIPDGRIVRGIGSVAEMFSEWQGMNAILTDQKGRVQWMGTLRQEQDRRPLIATIQRLAALEK